MTESKIDRAIDRAVRDLMDVDADGAFRARVNARLERPVGRRLRVLPLAMSAAAVVLALVWLRSTPPAPSAPGPVATLQAPAVPAIDASASAGRPAPAAPPRESPAPRPAPRRAAMPMARGAIVAAVAGPEFTAAPPLPPLDAIEVEPISQTPSATAQIVVAPLSAIPDLQISPLEPPTAR